MRSEFRIRPLTEADLPAVLAIEQRCFPEDPWPESVFRSALADELCFWLAAEKDGKVVGYAGMQAVLDEGYVDNVAVDPEHRRQGAALSLMKGLLAESRRKELRFLSLEVRAGNAPAIALYSSLGFETVGKRPGYYLRPPEDALIMTKTFAGEIIEDKKT